jgi:hypothetical protein
MGSSGPYWGTKFGWGHWIPTSILSFNRGASSQLDEPPAELGSGVWTRTTIHGFRNRCPPIGRHRNRKWLGGKDSNLYLSDSKSPVLPIKLPPSWSETGDLNSDLLLGRQSCDPHTGLAKTLSLVGYLRYPPLSYVHGLRRKVNPLQSADSNLERTTGIEPVFNRWQRFVLPMYEARENGIQPRS